jgi:hypothetical protein
MNNKHKHIPLILAFVFSAVLSSCVLFMKGDKHDPETKYVYGDYTKAEVINYAIDGCTWMLQLKDGKKLQPSYLKPEFQKDKLKVWIKYSPKKGGVGICMAGEMVNITEIELRKNE